MSDTCYICLEEDGKKTAKSSVCGVCGNSEFLANGRCAPCNRRYYAERKSRNPDTCREYYRRRIDGMSDEELKVFKARGAEYRATNRESQREWQRYYWERKGAEKCEQLREKWRNLPEEERAKRIAQKTDRVRQDRAVEEGKTSPLCRKIGFLLVLCADERSYRAARADKPLAAGETALCSFSAGIYPGTWIINRATVVPTAHRALADRTYARLRKREGEPKNRTGRPSK